MCLAVPGKIESIKPETENVPYRMATVDFQGSRVEASLAMTPEAGTGDWVLVHAGFALTVLDEEEARETWETLQVALGPSVAEPAPGSGS